MGEYIPPPPAADKTTLSTHYDSSSNIDELEVLESLNALGEPTLQSLGIGSWWPHGLVQQLLEFLHVNCGLEWYQAVLVCK